MLRLGYSGLRGRLHGPPSGTVEAFAGRSPRVPGRLYWYVGPLRCLLGGSFGDDVDSQPLAQMQDTELLERFGAGRVEAFGVLLERYQVPIYNFILRSVRDPAMAEDLAQETFTRIIQGASSFRAESKFSTWLYRVARNLCIDHARKMKHRRHRSLDAPAADADGMGTPLVERVALDNPGTDAAADGPTLRARIADAIQQLPEEQREVFLLRQVQQLPYAEIGSITGTSENTAKSRMRYALLRLQELLSDVSDAREAVGQ